MIFTKTKLDGVFIVEPELRGDERGYFTRIFCKNELKEQGLGFDVVQVNQSLTKDKGAVRGLHYQKVPMAEDKLICCLKGEIFDVAVDMRVGSPTFGQWVSERLSEDNKKMLLVPKGFAHGFQTMTSDCLVRYFVSEFYSPEHEAGFLWSDPFLNISWPISVPSVISQKDQSWSLIQNK